MLLKEEVCLFFARSTSRAKTAKDRVGGAFKGCINSHAAVCTKDSEQESSGIEPYHQCLQTHPHSSALLEHVTVSQTCFHGFHQF